VQFTDSFAQSIAVTGVTYSGSFEVSGNANDLRDATWSDGAEDTTLPKYVSTMTIEIVRVVTMTSATCLSTATTRTFHRMTAQRSHSTSWQRRSLFSNSG